MYVVGHGWKGVPVGVSIHVYLYMCKWKPVVDIKSFTNLFIHLMNFSALFLYIKFIFPYNYFS